MGESNSHSEWVCNSVLLLIFLYLFWWPSKIKSRTKMRKMRNKTNELRNEEHNLEVKSWWEKKVEMRKLKTFKIANVIGTRTISIVIEPRNWRKKTTPLKLKRQNAGKCGAASTLRFKCALQIFGLTLLSARFRLPCMPRKKRAAFLNISLCRLGTAE